MKDLKKISDKDLNKELTNKRQAVSAFRFGTAGSKGKNVKEGKNLKKDIARILTEINSRV
jgi:ribosomal protein L29